MQVANQKGAAPNALCPLGDQREEFGGPREGSGGAVTDAMWAAAIGCRECAKGENFSN